MNGEGVIQRTDVMVRAGEVSLEGNLAVPEDAAAIVVFAHGSGSSRHSPRNRFVADAFNALGLATLLFDLLTPNEETIDLRTGVLRFDIKLLADRLTGAVDWLGTHPPTQRLRVGLFGEPGKLAAVAAHAGDWFQQHLARRDRAAHKNKRSDGRQLKPRRWPQH